MQVFRLCNYTGAVAGIEASSVWKKTERKIFTLVRLCKKEENHLWAFLCVIWCSSSWLNNAIIEIRDKEFFYAVTKYNLHTLHTYVLLVQQKKVTCRCLSWFLLIFRLNYLSSSFCTLKYYYCVCSSVLFWVGVIPPHRHQKRALLSHSVRTLDWHHLLEFVTVSI